MDRIFWVRVYEWNVNTCLSYQEVQSISICSHDLVLSLQTFLENTCTRGYIQMISAR